MIGTCRKCGGEVMHGPIYSPGDGEFQECLQYRCAKCGFVDEESCIPQEEPTHQYGDLKLSPCVWEQIDQIKVLDMDGWRKDDKSFLDVITYDEFNERVSTSTIEQIFPEFELRSCDD